MSYWEKLAARLAPAQIRTDQSRLDTIMQVILIIGTLIGAGYTFWNDTLQYVDLGDLIDDGGDVTPPADNNTYSEFLAGPPSNIREIGVYHMAWDPPTVHGDTVTYYNIYKSEDNITFSYYDIVTWLTNDYQDTMAVIGEDYYYSLSSNNSVGEGAKSNAIRLFQPITVPNAPVLNVIASLYAIEWTVPYNGGSNLIDYGIYLSYDNVVFNLADVVIAPSTYWEFTEAVPGETYFAKVTAENFVGEGEASNVVTMYVTPLPTFPSAPRDLTQWFPDEYSLTWLPPTFDGNAVMIGYNIYRGATAGSLVLLDSVGAAVLHYSDLSAITGNTYVYAVTAVNDVGESVISNTLEITEAIPLTVPGAPTWGYVGIGNDGSWYCVPFWNTPADNGGTPIISYTIWKKDSAGGSWYPLVVVGLVNTYKDYAVAYGGDYYYKILATNAIGDGPFSVSSAGTPHWPI